MNQVLIALLVLLSIILIILLLILRGISSVIEQIKYTSLEIQDVLYQMNDNSLINGKEDEILTMDEEHEERNKEWLV